jgi:hypothetical protein
MALGFWTTLEHEERGRKRVICKNFASIHTVDAANWGISHLTQGSGYEVFN